MKANPGAPNVDFARRLVEHCCWEDERVWTLAIAPLSDEQFSRDVDFGLRSIQRECAHIMNTERMSLGWIRGERAVPPPDGRLDRRTMRAQWREIHSAWHDFINELDADLLVSDCLISNGEGAVTLTAWQLIFDVIYQGTTHRSDILRMVAEVHEPPAFDLSLMQFLSGVFRQ